MILYGICAIFLAFWILSIVAAVLAIRWSARQPRQRFLRTLISSFAAIMIGFLGSTWFHITSTSTNSDGSMRRYDTRWLFAVSLILGIFALAYAIWKRRRSPNAA